MSRRIGDGGPRKDDPPGVIKRGPRLHLVPDPGPSGPPVIRIVPRREPEGGEVRPLPGYRHEDGGGGGGGPPPTPTEPPPAA